MSLSELNESLARAAHGEWRRRMLSAGWSPGDRYDADRRTHPAVRPYEEIAPYWRRQLIRYIASERRAEELIDDVELVLGTPEGTVGDVRVGMRVTFDNASGDVGTIESWDLADEESGALDIIRVRWPSGNVEEYHPAEHALARVPE